MSYPFYDICFIVEGFSEDQDFDNIYLGIDRVLPIKTEVKLTAMFGTSDAYAAFMNWWIYNVERGVKVFIVQLKVFGNVAYYGIEQQTSLTSSIINGTGHEITFTAKVVIDETNAINNIPQATPLTISMEVNEQNIYIQLGGVDLDNDPLTYEILTLPTNGTLSGTPPLMVYTPFTDFIGTDTFTYIVSDFFSDSQPATVTLNVGALVLPTFIVEYSLSAPIRITGNFFYNIGDDVWRRGIGGYVTPLTNTLQIASNDHKLDGRDDVVTSVKIITWGTRTDFRYFLKNKTNILTCYIESTAGVCVGKDYYEAFYNTRIPSLPPLAVDTAEILTGMFELATTPIVTFSNDSILATHFDRMFKNSGAKRVIGLGTTSGKYFQEMFSGATQLVCISNLDTSQKLNTTNMFYNTPALLNPDSSGRILLENGALHSYTGCGVKIDSISTTSSTSCDTATVDGICTSSASYTANVSSNVGAVTYNWITSGPVTITGGDTTATVSVNVTGSGGTLTCTATDTVSTSQASVSPVHNVVYTCLTLYLPQSSSQINLETYINENNPLNKTEILIYNNVSNASIASGELTGKNVKLVLNANIHGFQKTRTNTDSADNHGLYLTSQLKLINNAVIAGAGGAGGAGGKGEDDTYSTTDINHWLVPTNGWCAPENGIFWMRVTDAAGYPRATQIFWNGDYRQVSTDPNITSYNWDGTTLYRGAYRGMYGCQGSDPTYDVVSKSTATPRIGGAGGLGGLGIGYNINQTAGSVGSPSTPAGGYSGGSGGTGGTWGTIGETGYQGGGGGAAGDVGYTPGNAIQGASFLKSGSVTGTCYGGIV